MCLKLLTLFLWVVTLVWVIFSVLHHWPLSHNREHRLWPWKSHHKHRNLLSCLSEQHYVIQLLMRKGHHFRMRAISQVVINKLKMGKIPAKKSKQFLWGRMGQSLTSSKSNIELGSASSNTLEVWKHWSPILKTTRPSWAFCNWPNMKLIGQWHEKTCLRGFRLAGLSAHVLFATTLPPKTGILATRPN